MEIVLTNIISKAEAQALDPKTLASIQEAINTAVKAKYSEIESDNAKKFDNLVEGLTEKFDSQVNTVIMESINGKLGDTINSKFYNIVKDMVNLLESAGIATTEKTKELSAKLQIADREVEKAVKERELVKEQLDDATKDAYILTKLKGMKPEIVDAALEYFKNKTLQEIDDDEIQAFLDGDFSNILMDEDKYGFSGDLDISQVEDALDEIKERRANQPSPSFESLGKGLKPTRATGGSGRNPDVSSLALQESTKALVENVGADVEDDTKDALSMIDEFMDLGYKFKV